VLISIATKDLGGGLNSVTVFIGVRNDTASPVTVDLPPTPTLTISGDSSPYPGKLNIGNGIASAGAAFVTAIPPGATICGAESYGLTESFTVPSGHTPETLTTEGFNDVDLTKAAAGKCPSSEIAANATGPSSWTVRLPGADADLIISVQRIGGQGDLTQGPASNGGIVGIIVNRSTTTLVPWTSLPEVWLLSPDGMVAASGSWAPEEGTGFNSQGVAPGETVKVFASSGGSQPIAVPDGWSGYLVMGGAASDGPLWVIKV
jgi:hypothetical protein